MASIFSQIAWLCFRSYTKRIWFYCWDWVEKHLIKRVIRTCAIVLAHTSTVKTFYKMVQLGLWLWWFTIHSVSFLFINTIHMASLSAKIGYWNWPIEVDQIRSCKKDRCATKCYGKDYKDTFGGTHLTTNVRSRSIDAFNWLLYHESTTREGKWNQ